ncbi:MAG: 50S ribosomal protein L15 [Spirochaetes bacterium RBG_13_68_11]|nr:MAG: 50S ribosomal protein L15 [Spirochaetes bacterium RBG_13_68_11]
MDEMNLRRPKGQKTKKILGRGLGSGHGKTAGRGTKGQGSRSGGSTRVGFEGGQMPLYRRIARRGFSNQPFKTVYQVVNVSDLNRFADGDTVTAATLRERGLARKRGVPVKVLGDGELTRKLVVDVAMISAAARAKIAALGGEVRGTTAHVVRGPAATGPVEG